MELSALLARARLQVQNLNVLRQTVTILLAGFCQVLNRILQYRCVRLLPGVARQDHELRNISQPDKQ